ncbi:MAG: UPF0158 family protein [Acidobacteriia bacterium]|nr:UPF0158 family protein [Terriglobia bacterium]
MTTPVVSLQAVINEMDVIDDSHTAFLNKRTGELVTLVDDEIYDLPDELGHDDAPPWQKELIEKKREVLDSEDYLELPTKFEIHEWAIMEEFCASLDNPEIRNEFLSKIHGNGAFRLFKDAIHQRGIAEDWYRFREKAFEKIAIGWLDANQIAYRQDTRESSGQPAKRDH